MAPLKELNHHITIHM